ncbi:Myc-type, basic helix-loop-helix (bHLH) domain, partial [Dillenia turbinata]
VYGCGKAGIEKTQTRFLKKLRSCVALITFLLHGLSDRQRSEVEVNDPIAARKVQKADREKLRRDRLNEQFLELENALDPERPKNDKGTILTDTIQMIKELTAEVNRLTAECAALSEESRELTQEKNELREEKMSLKSEIENLNVQYQQRMRGMYPWAAMDPSVVMGPPPYSYPVPVAVPPAPLPMHPSLQPFPFFGNQNPNAFPNPYSTFIPYPAPAGHTVEQPSTHVASTSHASNKQDSRSKSLDHQRACNAERSDDNEVGTELELKTPGSASNERSSGEKGKLSQSEEISAENGSCSSRYSSSHDLEDSSSNSIGNTRRSDR